MTKVIKLKDRLPPKQIDYYAAEDMLELLLSLKDNQMMIIFNKDGVLQYTIQTITGRFKTEL